MTYCASLGRVAMAGANCVRVLDANADYNEIKGDAVDLDANQAIEKVGWTKDGQVSKLRRTRRRKGERGKGRLARGDGWTLETRVEEPAWGGEECISRTSVVLKYVAVAFVRHCQVLTVGTHNGYMHSFLASLPMVYDFHGTRVLYLTR